MKKTKVEHKSLAEQLGINSSVGHISEELATPNGTVGHTRGHTNSQAGHTRGHTQGTVGHAAQQSGHAAQQSGHAAQQSGHAAQQKVHYTVRLDYEAHLIVQDVIRRSGGEFTAPELLRHIVNDWFAMRKSMQRAVDDLPYPGLGRMTLDR